MTVSPCPSLHWSLSLSEQCALSQTLSNCSGHFSVFFTSLLSLWASRMVLWPPFMWFFTCGLAGGPKKTNWVLTEKNFSPQDIPLPKKYLHKLSLPPSLPLWASFLTHPFFFWVSFHLSLRALKDCGDCQGGTLGPEITITRGGRQKYSGPTQGHLHNTARSDCSSTQPTWFSITPPIPLTSITVRSVKKAPFVVSVQRGCHVPGCGSFLWSHTLDLSRHRLAPKALTLPDSVQSDRCM